MQFEIQHDAQHEGGGVWPLDPSQFSTTAGVRPAPHADTVTFATDMAIEITTRALTKADYDYIVKIIDKWWGGPTSALAHPVYFYELGEHAMVAEHDGRVVGFLLGFVAASGVGYVHLVGIDPDYRRQQVGSTLYRTFESRCRAAGCKSLKAITTLGNDGSVRFHGALGWTVEEVADYAGPGRARMVFAKALGDADA